MKKIIGICILILCSCSKNKNIYKYELLDNWPNISNDFVLGNPTGLALNSKEQLVVFHRGSRSWQNPMPKERIEENAIFILDNKTGEIINSWGSNLFIMPHGLEVDNDDNIWVTDVGLHQVFKFSSSGEKLMVLGEESKAGDDQNHFNLPTDIAVAEDGSFYVSDGYGNSRVIKFSKSGEYQFEWGKFGNGDSEFNIPHGIDLDGKKNVYVADRENNRIQKFDSLGNFIKKWQNMSIGQLYSLNINTDKNYLIGIDYIVSENLSPIGSDIFYFDLDLNLKTRFGRTGNYDGKISRYHDVQVDKNKNIFVGDILNNTIQKFVPTTVKK